MRDLAHTGQTIGPILGHKPRQIFQPTERRKSLTSTCRNDFKMTRPTYDLIKTYYINLCYRYIIQEEDVTIKRLWLFNQLSDKTIRGQNECYELKVRGVKKST